MTTTPRRAWFQIHLSTAVVLMFVAGGLMWGSFISQQTGERKTWGWPFVLVDEWDMLDPDGDCVITNTNRQISLSHGKPAERKLGNGNLIWAYGNGEVEFKPTEKKDEWVRIRRKITNQYSRKYVVCNVLVALCLLATVMFVCEWCFRRREAASHDHHPMPTLVRPVARAMSDKRDIEIRLHRFTFILVIIVVGALIRANIANRRDGVYGWPEIAINSDSQQVLLSNIAWDAFIFVGITLFTICLSESLARAAPLQHVRDLMKNRKALQFRLSTAIIALFVAAGLLWLNLTPRYTHPRLSSVGTVSVQSCKLGWPMEITCYFDYEKKNYVLYPENTSLDLPFVIAVNIVVIILIVRVTFSICEYLIRRREAGPP
jgi:hypothetical protein